MAQVDSSIALGVKPFQLPDPVNALAKAMQIQGMQQEQGMNAMKMDEYQRGIGEKNRLTSLLSGGADANALRRGGFLKEAADWEKSSSDTAEAAAKTKKLGLEASNLALTQHRAMLNNVNDPQTAKQWLAAAYQNPDTKVIFERFGPLEVAMQRFDSMVTTPEAFQKWKQGASMNADELIKFTTPDANTVANNTTSRANNAASVGATMRGQNMTDARSRESNAAALTKPFEVTGEDGKPVLVQQDKAGNIRPVQGYLPKQGASKPLTEGQAKANLFGTRMQESHKILSDLEDEGVTNPGLIKSTVQGAVGLTPFMGDKLSDAAGSVMNVLPGIAGGPSSKQQMVDQARRNFINAALRRESGAVISQPEFSNADRQYFPQPGDSKEVLAQKRRNRETAIRGLQAEIPGGFRGGTGDGRAPPGKAATGSVLDAADAILNGGK